MRKYKLEIAIAAIFESLLVGLMWETLAEKFSFLPYVLLGLGLAFLLAAIVSWKGVDSEDGAELESERYAPKFFAQAIISSVDLERSILVYVHQCLYLGLKIAQAKLQLCPLPCWKD